MEPNPYLVASSLFLALPAIPFLIKNDLIGATFAFLCSTFSMTYHATKPNHLPIVLFFDKIFAYVTCIYSTKIAIYGLPYSIITLTTLIGGAIIIYHVGYVYKCFLWHTDHRIATAWHVVFHIGNSIACTIIVYLSNN
jgi:hypothetical protein